jgi:hypothetical protein
MATLANTGIAKVADTIGDTFPYVGVGTGTGAESASDTALGTEVTAMRTLADISVESGTKTVWSVTLTYDATRALRETALFDADTAGTMLLRHLWATARNGDEDDTLELTFKLTNAQGT